MTDIKITKPTLILDEEKCRKNLKTMHAAAENSAAQFRPHFKTHQSLEIGRWFKDLGVDKITVSSFEMAKYFSEEWDDITVAFPVNILEIETINDLASRLDLNILIESTDAAAFLIKHLKHKTGFFIKIDTGYHRTGIDPSATWKIDQILEVTKGGPNLEFRGFLAHAGHTYECRSKDAILNVHEKSVASLMELKERYIENFPGLLISIGDTPSCSVATDFSMVDELRPGNFVFYDLSQYQIGSCEIKEISVAIACPIVAIHEERNEIVIYGGGVHLSKESLNHKEYGTIYGLVAEKKGDAWGEIIPGMFVKSLSQEHGIVAVPTSEISSWRVGDYVLILPVHSCMTANLMKEYLTTGSDLISRL